MVMYVMNGSFFFCWHINYERFGTGRITREMEIHVLEGWKTHF